MSATRDVSNEDARVLTASIDVSYRYVDGYHVFRSDDVRGLYVASKDARKAYEDVPVILKELIEMKVRVPCTVEASLSFEKWLETESNAAQSPILDVPLTLGNRRYLVREAA